MNETTRPHTTLVGRIEEVQRFGTKMLAIQPLFDGELLGPVLHGGAAIYRLTLCSREIAWARQPTQGYQLPAAIRATVPEATALLPLDGSSVMDADFDEVSGG
jgi:hypothetical protein